MLFSWESRHRVLVPDLSLELLGNRVPFSSSRSPYLLYLCPQLRDSRSHKEVPNLRTVTTLLYSLGDLLLPVNLFPHLSKGAPAGQSWAREAVSPAVAGRGQQGAAEGGPARGGEKVESHRGPRL